MGTVPEVIFGKGGQAAFFFRGKWDIWLCTCNFRIDSAKFIKIYIHFVLDIIC